MPDSTRGEGTVVRLLFPVTKAPHTDTVAEVDVVLQKATSRDTVVLVDEDDPDFMVCQVTRPEVQDFPYVCARRQS